MSFRFSDSGIMVAGLNVRQGRVNNYELCHCVKVFIEQLRFAYAS